MDQSTFHFKIGTFECMAVSDGGVPEEGAAQVLFTNAPQRSLEQALLAHKFPSGEWTELFNCLVINTGEHCVLVDTGLGVTARNPHAGKLLQNLRTEGIAPDDIDTVIISHAHGDHIGGNTDADGRASFPHASYYMHKVEWDFWTSPQTLANPSHQWMDEFVQRNLLPVRDKFELLTKDMEIVPGIKSISASGHTPGNIALVIESNDEKLFYLGDILLHPIHLEHPDWYSSFDCLPAATVNTRRFWLEHATTQNALMFLYHFDFPGLGYSLLQHENWQWQAVASEDSH